MPALGYAHGRGSATGYSIYFNGRWEVFGGTSFVAPELAGLFAIVAKGNGGKSATAPAVVACLGNGGTASSDFNDITTGSNGFAAGTGWDHPTGFGTPNAANFVTDINAHGQP